VHRVCTAGVAWVPPPSAADGRGEWVAADPPSTTTGDAAAQCPARLHSLQLDGCATLHPTDRPLRVELHGPRGWVPWSRGEKPSGDWARLYRGAELLDVAPKTMLSDSCLVRFGPLLRFEQDAAEGWVIAR